MNPTKVLEILDQLRLLPFFPIGESVMDALVKLCGSMCHNEDQVQWLVDRMTSGIYEQWPGPREMRAVFCGRYKPKDGVNAYSTIYPDGLPPDPTAPKRQIEAPAFKSLPAGHQVTADPVLEAGVAALAEKCAMPSAHPAVAAFERMLREIVTPPDQRESITPKPTNPDYVPVTQADVDQAVKELHERQKEPLS